LNYGKNQGNLHVIVYGKNEGPESKLIGKEFARGIVVEVVKRKKIN
jgi:hypothetical protein